MTHDKNMPIPGLNHDRCLTRNRVAARRDGANAFPLRFLRTTGGDYTALAMSPSPHNRGGVGNLPKSDAEALTIINAGRGEGATPLTLDDVYIHYLEAANTNYIGDRYMFLDVSTLKNIATDAQAGFAFMNSHRTGGLSHPAELPYGKTFAGRFEKVSDDEGEMSSRTVVGVYMLRGVHPNGQGGPSTDDFHKMIDAGTLFDCSVGLYDGAAICDICGEDLDGYDRDEGWLCPHVPGTTYKMDDEDMAGQENRGVPGGVATYSLVDSHCGEVSGVYDGAVPGAGFGKALALARSGDLDDESLLQVESAYTSLLKGGKLHHGAGRSDGEAADALMALLEEFSDESESEDHAPHDHRPAAQRGKGDAMSYATQTRQRKSLTAATLGAAILAALGMGGGEAGATAPPKREDDPTIVLEFAAPPAVDAPPPATAPAESPEMLAMKAQLNDLDRQLKAERERANKNEADAALRADEAAIEKLRRNFQITPAVADELMALAKQDGGHIALSHTLPILAKGAPNATLAPTGESVDGNAATGNGGDFTQLEKLTKEYQKDHPAVSYADALQVVCRENKELAAAYYESQKAGA